MAHTPKMGKEVKLTKAQKKAIEEMRLGRKMYFGLKSLNWLLDGRKRAIKYEMGEFLFDNKIIEKTEPANACKVITYGLTELGRTIEL